MSSIFILEENLRVNSLSVVSFGVNYSQIVMQRGSRDDFFRVKKNVDILKYIDLPKQAHVG